MDNGNNCMIHSAKSHSFVTEECKKQSVHRTFTWIKRINSFPFLFVLEEAKQMGRICFLESGF